MTVTAGERLGVAVLLVYGIQIPVARVIGGVQVPGFRLTVQCDGAVWVQPMGYHHPSAAERAQYFIHKLCLHAGLLVESIPVPGTPPGFVVRRHKEV